MRDTFTFLKNFIQHPTAVGAISPSSQVLARTMIDWVDWENARGVVEFGPGTGVFTEAIQQALHPDAGFIAIEQSPELAQATRLRVAQPTLTPFAAKHRLHRSMRSFADCRGQRSAKV